MDRARFFFPSKTYHQKPCVNGNFSRERAMIDELFERFNLKEKESEGFKVRGKLTPLPCSQWEYGWAGEGMAQ